MKRSLCLLASTVLLFLLFASVGHAASNAKILLEYDHDVTGDGKPEKITVHGIPFDNNSAFYKKVWAEVVVGDKVVRIDYEGGYEPKLEFADLNHDGVDDILYSSATGGSGGIYNYALDTLKGGKLVEIPLPKPLPIEAYFENNFKAVINIPGMGIPIKLDLSKRKEDYIRLGLYQKNGLLNEATELMIDPIAMFKIEKVPDKKGYGLRSFRQISGAYHADGIGTVEVLWYYKNNQWHPIQIQWKPYKN